MEAPTWLRHTLEEIIGQIRRLLDVSGCAFQVLDFEEGMIRPAAAWFASDEARDSMTPVLERPYDPGLTPAGVAQESDGTHTISTLTWLPKPPARSASVTDR